MYPPSSPSPSAWQPPLPLRPVRSLANLALGALALDCLAGVASAASDVWEVSVIDRLLTDPYSVSDAELDASDLVYTGSAFVQKGTFVVAAVAFLVWLFRVRSNAELLAPDGHRHPRPWLVLAWAVPIVCWWYPKQLVDDIWAASRPAAPPRRLRVITAWWTLWVLTSAVTYVASRVLGQADEVESLDDLEGLAVVAMADMGSVALWIVVAALAASMIGRITDAQEALTTRQVAVQL
ncbi:DUF4328 domain-containing protein [Nonomuraea sp. NPDC050383]|uniref:DUF4328 domain-containing protein n=1 Tax=Nonomuraea sp. NPDC050383 TaxID=3364362 RepID=UPI0037987C2C